VEAAADVGNLNERASGAVAPGSGRANPVALEVRVNATGARPSTGSEKRELFSEDTQTALVFPDAAVIALSAAVVPGQLVFLTNKENNREVVCQVVRKKNNRPTSCYVELQFTEAQSDFWGIKFSEKAQLAVATHATELEEKVVSAEETEEPAAEKLEQPNSEDVAFLKREVDVLREQLTALTEAKQREEEAAKKALEEDAQRQAQEEAARKAQEEVDAAIAVLAAKRAAVKPLVRMNLPAAPADTKARSDTPTSPVSLAALPSAATPTHRAMTSASSGVGEKPGHSEEREAFEDLLPQPELDFSNSPTPIKRAEEDDPYSIYKPLRKPVGTKGIVATILTTVLLAGGLGFAWYKDLLPIARRKSKSEETTAKHRAAENPAATKVPVKSADGSAASATAETAVGAGSQTADGPVTETKSESTSPAVKDPSSVRDDNSVGAGHGEGEGSTLRSEVAPQATASEKKAVTTGRSVVTLVGKKRGVKAATETPTAAEPEPTADAPTEAAKLVRAAKPVYPPDAMRRFITGDVRISAEVEANGKIGKVSVISGPAALREAAIAAMKQYEYEPATKGGKAVASQVVVTIKFWFDP
jgi:TonB family protein